MKKNLLMLHGWNWKNYSKHNQGNPWSNRFNFLQSLQERFEVTAPVLPGFCDSTVPDISWTLDDYATWLFEQVQKNNYDILLGYSFGAAVIIRFLTLYKDKLTKLPKIILISPAIVRKYQYKSSIVSTFSRFTRLFPNISNMLRDFYLQYIIKNKFYTEGDTFQRETYRNIVGVDLSKELEKLIQMSVSLKLIFGAEDTSTPPEILFSNVSSARSITYIIQGGGHDIANSHTEELIDLIQI